ncbi:MAG: hypothetical protein RI562_09250 [Salibacter sp.]|uniref:hypothetical protein n=1 Tax=Salibacter sp. TaxID=2010995 RepID=UPI0028708834|nr:hypothetical protein [Salibacter sp.]MDR9399237.1 hypothetical protein [Salibacter sp.]
MKTNFNYIIFMLAISAFFFNTNSAYSQHDTTQVNQKEVLLKLPVSSLLGDMFTNSMGVSIGLEKLGENGWSFAQEAGFLFKASRQSIMLGGESRPVKWIAVDE